MNGKVVLHRGEGPKAIPEYNKKEGEVMRKAVPIYPLALSPFSAL